MQRHCIAIPIKKKILWCNYNPFMNKSLRRSIVIRLGLKNRFNKKTAENQESYRKQ